MSVLTACGASLATLALVFLANARNPALRVSVFSGFHTVSAFLWLFISLSLAMCYVVSRDVAYTPGGVEQVFGATLFASAVLSAGASVVVWRAGPRRVLRRFSPRPPSAEESRWAAEVDRLAASQDLRPSPRLMVSDADEAVALTVSGPEETVVLSAGLLRLLDDEETAAVMAHELMHIRNRDPRFKVFSSVFSRVLFLDPLGRLLDAAVNREREYLADEMAARATGRPVALASALLKMGEAYGGNGAPAPGLSIVGRTGGPFARYPPLKERIERLLRISSGG